jgi:hypothetical protein
VAVEGRSGARSDMTANERLRRRYRPDDVRVLFVGESPPAGGTFFYRANSKLYDATREAFEAAIPALRREDDFLAAFQRLGCYLDDLCLEPVNDLHMRDSKRLAQRERGVAPLARRMKPRDPAVVCVVMKAIVTEVGRATDRAELDVQREALPFPARHRAQYVRMLTHVVKRWRRRGVLHPLDAAP